MLDPRVATNNSTAIRTRGRLPSDRKLLPLEAAILQGVAYADVFDFPLTHDEIHHYLVGISASSSEVKFILDSDRLTPKYLERHDRYFTLAGRSEIVGERLNRSAASNYLWPSANNYGQLIAQIPFVRMVAVTGALAVNNVDHGDDIDYLIVTEPGRLWLCRSLVILLVKLAERRGELLCPNYFLSESALALTEQDLFTAHELLQMVPITGSEIYKKMLLLNSWAARFLPNAYARMSDSSPSSPGRHPLSTAAETVIRTRPGNWFEKWEMDRKIAKFGRQGATRLPEEQAGTPEAANLVEVSFSPDRCKGHFNHHGSRALRAYDTQLKYLAKEG